MFKCQNEYCRNVVQPRQPVNRIVVENRTVYYDKEIIRYHKVVDVEKVRGSEIAKEIIVCPQCFVKLTGKKPKMVIKHKPQQTSKSRSFNDQPPRKKKWQNPKNKKGNTTPSGVSTFHQSSTPQQSKSSSKPIVETVNPIRIIKE